MLLAQATKVAETIAPDAEQFSTWWATDRDFALVLAALIASWLILSGVIVALWLANRRERKWNMEFGSQAVEAITKMDAAMKQSYEQSRDLRSQVERLHDKIK